MMAVALLGCLFLIGAIAWIRQRPPSARQLASAPYVKAKLFEDSTLSDTCKHPLVIAWGIPLTSGLNIPGYGTLDTTGTAVATGVDDETVLMIVRPKVGPTDLVILMLGRAYRRQGQSVTAPFETTPPVRMILRGSQVKLVEQDRIAESLVQRLIAKLPSEQPDSISDGYLPRQPVYVDPPQP
jgi:hypothetical protein